LQRSSHWGNMRLSPLPSKSIGSRGACAGFQLPKAYMNITMN